MVSTHQRLELDLPSDWSATGLQGFTVFAQFELHRASQHFEQPMLAEIAWQQLDPALREYIRARQRFELALSLQWNATFQSLLSSSQVLSSPFTGSHLGAVTPLEPTPQTASREQNRSQNPVRPPRVDPKLLPRRRAKPARTPRPDTAHAATSSNSVASTTAARESTPPIRPASVGDLLEEPDPARSPETNLEPLLRAERSRWQREKLELTQRLFHVEAEKEVLFGKWTKVKGYLERQKAGREDSIGDARGAPSRDSGSKRVASLAISPSQAANIERLSSALMAHLVRLEGYRVKVREIPNLTGELAPWRVVITHLLEQGAVQREGNGQFIALSLVERLRRNLPAPKADPSSAARGKARGVGVR